MTTQNSTNRRNPNSLAVMTVSHHKSSSLPSTWHETVRGHFAEISATGNIYPTIPKHHR